MDKEVPRFLIVDGHSMIFAWEHLAEMQRRNPGLARLELTKLMTDYQDSTGERVVLVFDGKGERVGRDETAREGIQVFYSRSGMSADAVIERLAAKYSHQYAITVASRDRAVLDGASASGANVISANGLQDLVDRAESDLKRRMEAQSRK